MRSLCAAPHGERPALWLGLMWGAAHISLFRFMCYTVPPRTGGTHYGRFTVCRCAVSPDGVSGFHQPDARGVSDPDPALRSRVPGAYGGVALRLDTPDGPPSYRLQQVP